MSDSLEPPAKRARLDADADASIYGASFDAPGSPVDDMDDDFYDTTPVKPAAQPVVEGTASSVFAAAAAAPGFHLPGLGGSVSEAPVMATQPTAQESANNDAPGPADASEDGELSDNDAFYRDQSAVVSAAANQAQALGASAQHGKMSQLSLHPVSLTCAKDAAPHVDAGGENVTASAAPAQEESDGDDLALAITNGLADEDDGKAEFLQAAEAMKDNKEAEWQLDSDASDSSDSSSSNDSSDDEAGSDDGELLDPEEQVRLLMAESMDEPGATKAKVKTLNEVEEQYEKPDITVTEQTKISELGKVESVVENIVVVKGRVSGDLQVLESGSALCLQNRTIIGKISEQIGRVEEPRYALGFNDPAEITTLGIAKDTLIYYVDDHSTFVFTEPLRAQKHTDASNLHDEETNEVEFSDDEKEAEYKRDQKAKKRARQDDEREPPAVEKPIPTGPKGHVDVPAFYQPMEYQGGGLKYSDDEDEDLGMYKPLARPDHFEQIVGHGAPLEDRSHVRRGMMRGRGPWGDRGRGFRGRGGFGGRGDFGGAQNDRGGNAGGRGDFGAGRGDRGGHGGQGDAGKRGGAQGGRGDRTCYACGQVGHQKRECPTLKPQLDRGRQQDQQQDNRQRGGAFQDQRSATSASPARNQRGQSQQSSQPQHSPPAKSKNKNRKQRLREKKEKEREQQQAQQQQPQQQQQHQQQRQPSQPQQHASPAPTAPSNANSYANNSTAGWPQQYSNSPQPAVGYAPPPPPQAVAPAYAAPMPYAQAPAPVPAAAPQQQQANWAAWAQWLQVVQTMQQQQQPQQAAAPPPPPPQPQAQPQPPPQYAYPYQQYQQNPAPPANPPQQNDQSAQSLHDILRALGGGGQR
jgi:H/ACA ribonucleoprotein complex non-core subunit NAF1